MRACEILIHDFNKPVTLFEHMHSKKAYLFKKKSISILKLYNAIKAKILKMIFFLLLFLSFQRHV
jgi:hypothetical protein